MRFNTLFLDSDYPQNDILVIFRIMNTKNTDFTDSQIFAIVVDSQSKQKSKIIKLET